MELGWKEIIALVAVRLLCYSLILEPFHSIARELKRMNDNAEKWHKGQP